MDGLSFTGMNTNPTKRKQNTNSGYSGLNSSYTGY